MLDWTTVASLATAAGTLVLAVATFSSVRSANRAARVAEQSLLAGVRPLLMASHLEDPTQKINFVDGHWVALQGGHGALEAGDEAVYFTLSLRNAGSGIAVLHGWYYSPESDVRGVDHADLNDFRRLSRDIYVPAGGVGFWQGAFRDPSEPIYATARAAAEGTGPVILQLLYGDQEGGQRTITQFSLTRIHDASWLVTVSRHWTLDRANPRD